VRSSRHIRFLGPEDFVKPATVELLDRALPRRRILLSCPPSIDEVKLMRPQTYIDLSKFRGVWHWELQLRVSRITGTMPSMHAGVADMNSWTESAVAVLRQRWLAGDTSGEIAAELGVSRKAVIGKAGRLHLPKHQTRPNPAWITRRRAERLADDY
jgi:hypothetical protein